MAVLAALLLGVTMVGGTFEDDGIGRQEVGQQVLDLVALINSTAPADDVFNAQFCGGILVKRDVVLTAAHCVAGRRASRVDVVVGADNLCRDHAIDGVRVRVKRIDVDDRYDVVSGRYDVAYLVLEHAQHVDIRPVAAAPTDADTHAAIAIGWGRASTSGVPSCRATVLRLTLLSPNKCADNVPAIDQRTFDRTSMLCAVPEGDARLDTCEGDSGGPLFLGRSVREAPLVGLVSWGRGCGNGIPGVYARVDVAVAPSPSR